MPMIVFDLDDTLYPEMDFVESALRAVAREAALTGSVSYPQALDILKEAESTCRGFDNLAAFMWDADPGKAMTAERMVEIYRTHKPDISLSDDVRHTLDELKRRDVPMGLITDGRSVTQRAKIEALGIGKYFSPENILISGETGYEKTVEEPFLKMMAQNPGSKRFVYLGDNPAKDFRWPNRLGWTTVQLDDIHGRNVHPQEIDVAADYRAGSHITAVSKILAYIR